MIWTIWLWALLGGSTAVLAEFLMKRGWDWMEYWYLYIAMAVVVNFSVYQMLQSGKWIPSIVVFGLVTAMIRIGLAFFILREPVSVHTMLAASVLFIPSLYKLGLQLFGRS